MTDIQPYPDGARVAVRDLAAANPAEWLKAYGEFVAAIRREMRQDFVSFDPAHDWRGTEHRVLLRNPYADIGITTLQGRASVWIAERADHYYRLSCEWIDLSAEARRWLERTSPAFATVALRLGCSPLLPGLAEQSDWLVAA